MQPEPRLRAMAALRDRLSAGGVACTDGHSAMSARQAAELSSSLIAVGGHGRSHVPLTSLPPAAWEDEIAGGRSDLAELTRKAPPRGFAYPHGRWNPQIRAAVERAGYDWAVTSRPALIDPRRYDRYALPRLAVGDVEPAELMDAIRTLGV
jgi:peptidoglycan/xylan/chitin deacetylase (PgdA/CDA1 family)